MTLRFGRILVGLLVLAAPMLVSTPLASATPLGLDATDTSHTAPWAISPAGTAGWKFTVLSPIKIDGLAIFDYLADGLGRPHDVGLWDSGGSLLASATVTSASMPLASASSHGDWLVESISPVVLAPGGYAVGAFFFDLDFTDPFLANATAVTIPQVAFGGNAAAAGWQSPSARFPTLDDGLFGASFTAVPVPEPSTELLLAIGLLAAGRRLRSTRH